MNRTAKHKTNLPFRKKLGFSLAAICLGFILALLVVEGILRAGAFFIRTPVLDEQAQRGKLPGDPFVILCAGDSHTYGKGADKTFSYPEQLQRLLSAANPKINWEVINLGMPGANSSQTKKQILDYLANEENPKPKFALVCTGHNNDHNLTLAPFLPEEISEQAPKLQWDYLFRNSRAFRLGQITLKRVEKLLSNKGAVPDTLYDEVIQRKEAFLVDWIKQDLGQIKETCDQSGCKMALVGYAINVPQAKRANREFSKEAGIFYLPNLNFGLPFISSRMDLIDTSGHPNNRGYGIIAGRVARFIAQNQLAPLDEEKVETAIKEYSK